MTLKELKAMFRLEGDDRVKRYLWSEVYLDSIANWAEVEACRRSRRPAQADGARAAAGGPLDLACDHAGRGLRAQHEAGPGRG